MKNRNLDLISSLFNQQDSNVLMLTASSDIGVRRNFGRNGARFAPQSILYHFKKFQAQELAEYSFSSFEVASQQHEKQNFSEAQEQEMFNIIKSIKDFKGQVINLGGGHDHAYPFFNGVLKSTNFKKIAIINIDAHQDTRTDNEPHSGTPFRQLDNECKKENKHVELIQIGVRKQTNSPSTQSELSHIQQILFSVSEVNEALNYISNSSKDYDFIFLSLDCDGIDQNDLPAVSANNPKGISKSSMLKLIKTIKDIKVKTYFGIYEYNPSYDNLSGGSGKVIANFIYEFLK